VNAKTQALFEARAEIVKALAHPTRLFIVQELSKGERCVCELRKEIGRLVVETTAKVTGKVLTVDDHQRLAEETNRQLAA